MRSRRRMLALLVLACLAGVPLAADYGLPAAQSAAAAATQTAPQSPEQFFGFRMGADTKLARWDRMVEYFRSIERASDRVAVREPGKTTLGNPFLVLEISSAETLKNLDRYKALERKLYFQGGAPTAAERDEIFRSGKAVVLVTCNIHSTEIGASQMTVELVHHLATDNSPRVRKILDNVIFLLVPSLNPDGQIMVVDWYNKNLGTPFESSGMPWLYHPYTGHDNNRDAYMLTQRESQLVARLLWHDWFPAVWLDEHQMGNSGARIFVMPATDPINPNVHPLIYRWNGILGQAQAAALEAAGKEGIIYNSTYTNFWQGAMAWAGWWHNQVGMLTEVASVRVASPVEQRRAVPGQPAPADAAGGRGGGGQNPNEPIAAPRDVTPRTEYPRPWLGGRWTLRDIVDYELIATMALLEAAADQREVLLRQIYEVNRTTVEAGAKGEPAAILVPVPADDPTPAGHLVDKLQQGGVEVWRADKDFEADGKKYPAGTFVIPMTQVFARYAKDLLEKQTYPEVRVTPDSPPRPPYDVTAWSLGMLIGVDVVFVRKPLGDDASMTKLTEAPLFPGTVTGSGQRYVFDYRGADSALAINRLFKEGAKLAFEQTRDDSGAPVTRVHVSNIARPRIESVASKLALKVRADSSRTATAGTPFRAPRVALYQPWTASMDEGWTRWVLEQYEFAPKVLHNADIKAGKLRQQYDAIVLADQQPRSIMTGNSSLSTRPEYRGGIGDDGLEALKTFVAEGGTLVMLGASTDLAIEQWPIPVRNLKRDLTREQHFAPGTIVRLEVDRTNAIGYGMPGQTYGFYNNSPFYALVEGFSSQKVSVPARYPNTEVVGSGWLQGEALMAGRAAVVVVETNPGRLVLFGIRPQHRAQTQATFPMLFNALYLSTMGQPGGGITDRTE
ncbi:MAG: M14 family zinc carboxypeptidase [Vicinamibacterales bacterium]